MRKLLILFFSLQFLAPTFGLDWDPYGGFYPEDTKGIPLLKKDISDLYIGNVAASSSLGISIDLKQPLNLRDFLVSHNDLVALLETNWWAANGDKTHLALTVNSYKLNYQDIGVTRGFFSGIKDWQQSFLPITLNSQEEILLYKFDFRTKNSKIAFYEPKLTFEKNLLINGDAEKVPVTENGWKQISGDWTKIKKAPSKVDPNLGMTSSFWPGASASGILEQEIDLRAYKDYLATENPLAVFGGYFTTFDGDKDTAEMVLESYDGQQNLLSSVSSGAANYDFWTFKSLSLKLSPKVASLKVKLIGIREKGQNCDAYFDNLTLVLPHSGPKNQYNFPFVVYDPDAGVKVIPEGDEALSEITGLTKPYTTLPVTKNTQDIAIKIDGAPERNGFTQHVFSYTPKVGEKLTLKAQRQGVAVQVINSRGLFIQDDGKMASTFVTVHLLPNQNYTILLSDYLTEKSGSYTLTVTREIEAFTGSDEEKMTALFGDRKLYLQKYDLVTDQTVSQNTFQFDKINPHIDSKPIRILKLNTIPSQKYSLKMDPLNLPITLYDSDFNIIKPTSSKDGTTIFTAGKSPYYWILAQAPRIKFYKIFTIEVSKLKK